LTVFRETASRTEKGLIARCQGTVVLLVDTGTPAMKPFLAGAIAQNSLLAFRGLSCLNNSSQHIGQAKTLLDLSTVVVGMSEVHGRT